MRVLVLGAGGTGGYFGARLAAAGIDTTFLVRAARAAHLREHSLVLRSPLGNIERRVAVVESHELSPNKWDLIILSCKAYDLDGAMDAIEPAVGEGAKILPLLNGVRHLELLDRRFDSQRVLGGLCHIGVRLSPDGGIEHLNRIQHLAFGAREDSQIGFCQNLAPILSAGGFAPVHSQNIVQDMWEKWTMLTAYAAITCMFRASIGIILESGGREFAAAALSESARIASACGFPSSAGFLQQSLATLTEANSPSTSSMLRDIQAGHPIECEHILGDFLTRAAGQGVSAPLLSLALVSLRAYEKLRILSDAIPRHA